MQDFGRVLKLEVRLEVICVCLSLSGAHEDDVHAAGLPGSFFAALRVHPASHVLLNLRSHHLPSNVLAYEGTEASKLYCFRLTIWIFILALSGSGVYYSHMLPCVWKTVFELP